MARFARSSGFAQTRRDADLMHDLPPFNLAVLLLPASAIYLTVFACALRVTNSPVAACVLGAVKAVAISGVV